MALTSAAGSDACSPESTKNSLDSLDLSCSVSITEAKGLYGKGLVKGSLSLALDDRLHLCTAILTEGLICRDIGTTSIAFDASGCWRTASLRRTGNCRSWFQRRRYTGLSPSPEQK